MVTLYHGTTVPFETPDLSKSRKGMDFGDIGHHSALFDVVCGN